MRFHLSALCFFLLSLTSWAEGDELCGTSHEKQSEPKSVPTKLVLIQSESIELNTADITNLLFGKKLEQSGSKIRASIQKLIDVKKAKVIRNFSVLAKLKETARHESVLQTIYPIEYTQGHVTPEKIDANGKVVEKGKLQQPVPDSYEERPVGTITEIYSAFSKHNKQRLSLHYQTDTVKRLPNLIYRTDKVGGFTHKLFAPSFNQVSISNHIQIQDSKTQLVAIHSVFDDKGKPLTNRKVIHFLTATLINIP